MPNSKKINTVTINITGREFKINCPKNKTDELKEAAKYLDEKMREIGRGGKALPIDRIAMTAGLNIAHELVLEKQKLQHQMQELNDRLLSMKDKLDQALAK